MFNKKYGMEEKRKVRIKISDLISFFVVFICVIYKFFLACNIFDTNSMQIYVIIVLFFAFSIISILNKKIIKKDFYKLCLFLSLGFIALLKIISVNYIFPIIIAGVFYDKENKEESFKKLIKYFLISLAIGYIITIFSNIIGILPSHNLVRYKNGIETVRYSLGFMHPAFVGIYYTFIVLAYFCINKVNKKNIIVTAILSLVIYKICDSRIMLICNYLFIIMLLISGNKTFIKIINRVIPYIFFILTIFTIVSTNFFARYKLNFLDTIFSGRLSIYNDIIYNMNILKSPFGNSLVGNVILDNYYLTIFLYFGFIGYAIWGIFYYITSKRIQKNIIMVIVQFVILIYGLADSNVIVTNINFMLSIQFLTLLYGKNKRNRV